MQFNLFPHKTILKGKTLYTFRQNMGYVSNNECLTIKYSWTNCDKRWNWSSWFLLLPFCFLKLSAAHASEGICMRERVNTNFKSISIISLRPVHLIMCLLAFSHQKATNSFQATDYIITWITWYREHFMTIFCLKADMSLFIGTCYCTSWHFLTVWFISTFITRHCLYPI